MENSTKIFGIGFQKTGTSSLQKAFEIMGYKACGARSDLLLPLLKDKHQKVLDVTEAYDAFFDHPWPQLYEWLDQIYPDAKYILSIREPESWYKSVSHHAGDLHHPIYDWIYGKGLGLPKYHKENSLNVYREHNAAVQKYFENMADRLLILHFPDNLNWEVLCDFLKTSIPDEAFPYLNKAVYQSKSGRKEKLGFFRYYKKKVKYKVQIMYLNWRKML